MVIVTGLGKGLAVPPGEITFMPSYSCGAGVDEPPPISVAPLWTVKVALPGAPLTVWVPEVLLPMETSSANAVPLDSSATADTPANNALRTDRVIALPRMVALHLIPRTPSGFAASRYG